MPHRSNRRHSSRRQAIEYRRHEYHKHAAPSDIGQRIDRRNMLPQRFSQPLYVVDVASFFSQRISSLRHAFRACEVSRAVTPTAAFSQETISAFEVLRRSVSVFFQAAAATSTLAGRRLPRALLAVVADEQAGRMQQSPEPHDLPAEATPREGRSSQKAARPSRRQLSTGRKI